MSAYMVDREHIRYLVEAMTGGRFRMRRTEMTPAQLGQMLWDENRKSIEARYPDTRANFSNAPGPVDETYVYDQHQPLPFERFDIAQVMKACDCYEYQSCEHEGWQASEAKKIIGALRKTAYQSMPGYEEAEWGVPEPKNPVVIR